MASYELRCDDPSTAIDQIGASLAAMQNSMEAIHNLNNQLSEHAGLVGEANGQLVNSMIAIGGKSMDEGIQMAMVVMKDSLLDPVFDAYVMKYGTRHDKDNRSL